MGSALGPHPFPEIVRDFKVSSVEKPNANLQSKMMVRYLNAVLAYVGGGSNAIGLFYPFVEDTSVAIYGRSCWAWVDTDQHAAT